MFIFDLHFLLHIQNSFKLHEDFVDGKVEIAGVSADGREMG